MIVRQIELKNTVTGLSRSTEVNEDLFDQIKNIIKTQQLPMLLEVIKEREL